MLQLLILWINIQSVLGFYHHHPTKYKIINGQPFVSYYYFNQYGDFHKMTEMIVMIMIIILLII